MSRIRKYYDGQFRRLTGSSTAAAAALERAAQRSARDRISPALAVALVHAELRLVRGETAHFPRDFVCDAGLGGLARWLRGAGYPAFWDWSLDDPSVIRAAQQRGATLLTTDSLMMERGILRDGIVPAVFVPSSVTGEEQLIIVVTELALPLRESRCMRCGGILRPVSKAAVADRIPPKTALWIEEYFTCSDCGQLFWKGTHWQRITEKLQLLQAER